MQKVENIHGYEFDSCTYIKVAQHIADEKIEIIEALLDKKIVELENRLSDLKEARDFIKTGKQIFLLKNNDSDYGYIDSKGNNYEYNIINGKPVLIDENFNLYEIVEYVDLSDIGQDKGSRSCIRSWIDKVIKVNEIGKS